MTEDEGHFVPQAEIPEAMREQQKRPEFDRNGWDYSSQSVGYLIETVVSHTGYSEAELRDALDHGGKAFGLKICGIMAANDSRGNLAVPLWENFHPKNIEAYKKWQERMEEKDKSSSLFIRSSAPEEDWLDERAGVYPTISLKNYLTQKEKLPEIPYVIQEEANGFGLVVDVGYSELLNQVTVKVASGRLGEESFGIYTSATDDMESSVGAWSPESKRAIASQASFGHKTLLETNFDFGQFAEVIYTVLKKVGIDFGVQLELTINPHKPKQWNLLSVRPSPQPIRGDLQVRPEKLGQSELLATSCLVNKVFDISGEFKTVIANTPSGDFSFKNLVSLGQEVKKAQTNKVAIPKETGIILYYPAINGVERFFVPIAMLGAYSKGAIGQMVRGPIRPSSYHFFTLRNSSEEYYNLVNLNVGMISITAKEGERINTKKPKNLRIISDGLIGQVFETEI